MTIFSHESVIDMRKLDWLISHDRKIQQRNVAVAIYFSFVVPSHYCSSDDRKLLLNDIKGRNLPGSIPSVFGAFFTGARIVRFLIVTFLQSYGCSVQNGESCKVIFEITMSLDHIICTRGPLVWLSFFWRYFFHHVWPCPFMVPLCPVYEQKYKKK